MQRFKALAGVGVWLVGLGYAAMWALTAPLDRAAAIDLHPETLSPALHVVGIGAALAMGIRLVSAMVRGPRRPEADDAPRPRRRFRRPDSTVQRIKARDHFGLRGIGR